MTVAHQARAVKTIFEPRGGIVSTYAPCPKVGQRLDRDARTGFAAVSVQSTALAGLRRAYDAVV